MQIVWIDKIGRNIIFSCWNLGQDFLEGNPIWRGQPTENQEDVSIAIEGAWFDVQQPH